MESSLSSRLINLTVLLFITFSLLVAATWTFSSLSWPESFFKDYVFGAADLKNWLFLFTYYKVISDEPLVHIEGIARWVTYPIVAIVVLSALLSLILLRVSSKNYAARQMSIALSSWAMFLAYIFLFRYYLLPGDVIIASILDYTAATVFALGTCFLAKFFSFYPEKLDFAAATALMGKATLPKLKVFARAQERIDQIERSENKWKHKWKVRFLFLFFGIGGKPYEGEGSFAFYDSNRYLLIAILLSVISLYLCSNSHWSRDHSGIMTLDSLKIIFALCCIFIVVMAMSLNVMFKIKAQYHLGSDQSRRRIEWIYLYLFTLSSILFLTIFVGMLTNITSSLGLIDKAVIWELQLINGMIALGIICWLIPIGFLVCLGLSIFYRGAIDPNLLIRKSTIYTIIALVMTVVFISVEGAVTSQAVVRLGLPSQSGAILAGTITALVFGPVRNRVEAKANQFVEYMLPASALAQGSHYETVVAYSDLGGFVRLTEEDENQALTMASLFHKEGRKASNTARGRVVKTIGDAVLMEFRSVEDAVNAVELFHRQYQTACEASGLPYLPVHSGIHAGMVVKANDGDIYGSTVNIAARLEGVAGPDDIVLSQAAKDKLTGGLPFLQSIGEQSLKNVQSPVECFKVNRVIIKKVPK